MEIKPANTPGTTPEPGMIRQVLAYSPELMLVKHHFEKNWVGAPHSHPHHQLVYVLSGSIEITVDGEAQIASAGDSFVVDGGLTHQARALEESDVLDVFTPVREDYAV